MKIILFFLLLIQIVKFQNNTNTQREERIQLISLMPSQNTLRIEQQQTQIESCLNQLEIVNKEKSRLQIKINTDIKNQNSNLDSNYKEYQYQIDLLKRDNEKLKNDLKKQTTILSNFSNSTQYQQQFQKSQNSQSGNQFSVLINNSKEDQTCQKVLQTLQDEIQQLRQDRQNLQQQQQKQKFDQYQYQQLQIKVLNLERQNKELTQQTQNHNQIQQENKSFKQQIGLLNLEISKQQMNIQNQNNQINSLKEQYNNQKIQLEINIETNNKNLDQKQVQIEQLEKLNQEIQIEIKEQRNQVQIYLRQNQVLQQNLAQIKLDNSRQLTINQEKLNQCNSQLNSVDIQLKQKDKQIGDLNTIISKFQVNDCKSKVFEDTINSLQIQIQFLQKESDNTRQLLNIEQDKNRQCQQSLTLQTQNSQNNIRELQQKIDQQNQVVQQLRDEINQYQIYDQLYKQCQIDKEKQDQKITNLQVISASVDSFIAQNEEYRKLNNNLREQISLLNTKINSFESQIQEFEIANTNLVAVIQKQNFGDNQTKYNEAIKDLALCEAKSQLYEEQALVLQKLNLSIQELKMQIENNESECDYIYQQNQDFQSKLDSCQLNLKNALESNIMNKQEIQSLEEYKNQTEILKQQVERLKNVIDLINIENERIVFLERQLQDALNNNDVLREESFKFEIQINTLQSDFQQCQLKYNDSVIQVENSNQLLQQQTESIQKLQIEIQNLRQELDSTFLSDQQYQDCNNSTIAQSLKVQIQNLQQQIEITNSQVDRQNKEISLLQQSNLQLQDSLKITQQSYNKCQSRSIELNTQITQLQSQIQQKINEISQIKLQTQKCKDQYDLQIIVVEEQSSKITKMQQNLASTSKQVQDMKSQNQQLSQQNQSLLRQSSQGQQMFDDIEQCNIDIQLVRSQKQSAEQQLAMQTLEVNKLVKKQELCEAIKQQRNEFADQIAILQENQNVILISENIEN